MLKPLPKGYRGRLAMVAGLLAVMALQLAHVARTTSATWDEPHHLYDGYMVWTRHDYRLNPEVPPLAKLTAALPLLGRRDEARAAYMVGLQSARATRPDLHAGPIRDAEQKIMALSVR